MALTQQDLQGILKCLQEVYCACNLEAFPTRALSALSWVVSSDFLNWCPTNFHQHRVLTTLSAMSHRPAITSQEADQIAHSRFLEHPFARYYLATNDGKAHKISDFINAQQLHRLEGLYQGMMHQIGMEDQMSLVLPVSSEVNNTLLKKNTDDIVIALSRPERSFSERDRFVLNLLRPHLFQAYLNAQTLTKIQQESIRLNRTMEQLGVIILAGDGKIQLKTQRAWELLTQYFQLTHQKNSLPETLQRWVNYQLSLIAGNEGLTLPCLPLQIEQENNRLIIRLMCDRQHQQYILLLEEQRLRSFSPQLLTAIGLTKREAEVLFWATKDKSTKEIASILSCSDKTIEKHFEHIYEKLEVRTRTAAVVKALELLGMLS
ncbi:helix-turn-helix transcriptional regulator [Gloeocapsopsis crepidinum LEGE 06123]|uniref:Helix-turn-helix transcriptional regulator n=1 Tax=Gloeocapsopsis crepidinum LEGE 06123 TaxID=588587 RepID=A0ABR9UVW8_9CHRO|nr:helix-turn-helix transcriptional regulator [Gloeocapsopsis crepidinum]MBE9192439.1 helix-turn-helix transcriptional regulator [Gloeocapsopsis crepidinum LEGE 06123]